MASDLSLLTIKAKDVLVKLKARAGGQTLACAESCTGGLFGATITGIPGSSENFLGGVVVYANSAKTNLLGVPVSLLRTMGAVSREVARAMALGAREKFGSDWAVGITGIAGPGGGTPQKPVGTVCFAVVGPGFELLDQQVFSGDREAVRQKSVDWANSMLLKGLS